MPVSEENPVVVIVKVPVIGIGVSKQTVGVVAKPCVMPVPATYVAAVPYFNAPLNETPPTCNVVAVAVPSVVSPVTFNVSVITTGA